VKLIICGNDEKALHGMEGEAGDDSLRHPDLGAAVHVPDPHLAAQAAAGDDAGVGGVELDAPGGAGVALQGLQAPPGLHLRDVDVVIAVGGRHHGSVRGEHHQKGGSVQRKDEYMILNM